MCECVKGEGGDQWRCAGYGVQCLPRAKHWNSSQSAVCVYTREKIRQRCRERSVCVLFVLFWVCGFDRVCEYGLQYIFCLFVYFLVCFSRFEGMCL